METNKKYRVINLWPNNNHFRVDDVLTKHPTEDKYGTRHQNHWEWIESPERYLGNFILVE